MHYQTEVRPSNEMHVLTGDKDYIGVAQKVGNFYTTFDDHLIIYNPATGEAERVHDRHCHMTFRCEEFHRVEDSDLHFGNGWTPSQADLAANIARAEGELEKMEPGKVFGIEELFGGTN